MPIFQMNYIFQFNNNIKNERNIHTQWERAHIMIKGIHIKNISLYNFNKKLNFTFER
jgi:hypothetical protein